MSDDDRTSASDLSCRQVGKSRQGLVFQTGGAELPAFEQDP